MQFSVDYGKAEWSGKGAIRRNVPYLSLHSGSLNLTYTPTVKKMLSPGALLVFCALLFSPVACISQSAASISTLGVPMDEDFNFLPQSGAVGITALPDGWLAQKGTSTLQGILAYVGVEREDSLLSLGNGADRALGLSADNDVYYINWKLLNTTSSTIYKMYVRYKGEQWSVEESCGLFGCSNSTNRIDFGYAINPVSDIAEDLSFTEVAALRFSSPNNGGVGDVNGEATGNSSVLGALISLPGGLAPGDSVMLRWEFTTDDPANNLAIDSVRVYFFDNQWYLESGKTDLGVTNWTAFSDHVNGNDTTDGRPEINPANFTTANQAFHFWDDVSSNSSNVSVSGTNSLFVIDDGVSVTLSGSGISGEVEMADGSSLDVSGNASADITADDDITLTVGGNLTGDLFTGSDATVTVSGNSDNTTDLGASSGMTVSGEDSDGLYTIRDNATLTFQRPVSSFLEVDSAYDGSTLNLYINEDDGHAHIPEDVSFYNLGLYGNGDGWGFTYSFTENDPLTLRGDFHYDNPANDLFYDDLHVRVSGDSCVFDFPNYTGKGMFATLIVDAGAVLVINDCYADSSGTKVLDITGNTFGDYVTNNGRVRIIGGSGFKSDLPVTNNGEWIIEENAAVTVVGTSFTNSGTVTVEDAGSFIQTTSSTLSNSGTFYVTRSQPTGQGSNIFNYWSTPVVSATIGDGGDVDGSRHYYYTQGEDDNADFIRFYDSRNMTVGEGYAVLGEASATFSGTVNNGDISYDLEESSQDGDADDFAFNLIGNPYPSAISAYSFIQENAVDNDYIYGTIKVFSQSQSDPSQLDRQADYIAINILGATDPEPVTGGDTEVYSFDDFQIASGQGFFVVAEGTGDDQVNFTNAMRGGLNNTFKADFHPEDVLYRFWIRMEDGRYYKNTLLGFIEGASIGDDRLFDAPNDHGAQMDIWTEIKGRQYEIQGLPPVEKVTTFIPVGMNVTHTGLHSLRILRADQWPEQQPVFLYDKMLGVFHDLRNEDYSFYPRETGVLRNRFYLTFLGGGSDDGGVTGLGDRNGGDNDPVIVTVRDGQIVLNPQGRHLGHVEWVDRSGRILDRKRLNTNAPAALATGIGDILRIEVDGRWQVVSLIVQ